MPAGDIRALFSLVSQKRKRVGAYLTLNVHIFKKNLNLRI